ncbi:MAG: hypothetical protein UX12_C0007G0006 [Candidatus Collierbacteria bacterium GW2011_GWC1_45_47]|uniref:Uncharacterized protein n=3 Tax=Candidatus Collieribacteriota TaxID=1752725 RepID=A0A0G1JKV7_9BACT|nr:MAG: hypothetical protein UW23_C0007G0006 [Candidatus Collierbacteria bacterium GW2011_GWA1_44_12]KKT38997.1 MAG: hypothetical protein UW26_C0009G0006 [Candidatus Collierbacteria bacterium GW2011_GWF1_44_12]KKT99038.1 MAG: hypothetical protein UW99_C0010G0007 [Candidatus Collierbacteria bacterium GW2011_GWC2_45_15]KKU09601.1 MAG: hypothetical protein UX12_C0007G0006 [Candidatus Collierbacteria bacterium GW2011_GWC1_45_47]
MPDELDEIINAEGPITQETIRALHKSGMELLDKAMAIRSLALAKLKMARELCSHPNKGGKYVCPDCGYDTSPDPY